MHTFLRAVARTFSISRELGLGPFFSARLTRRARATAQQLSGLQPVALLVAVPSLRAPSYGREWWSTAPRRHRHSLQATMSRSLGLKGIRPTRTREQHFRPCSPWG